MPGVQVEYRSAALRLQDKRIVSAAIRRFGAKYFSTDGLSLDEEDFSVKYLSPDEGDELRQDIIVRVPLHHFPSRLEDTDGKSRELANTIKKALVDSGYRRSISIGVSILVCEIGWGRSVLDIGPSRQLAEALALQDPWSDAEACGGMGVRHEHHVGTD